MSGCTDNRFARMLYAYELGMLSAEERRELEIHLLECDSCFQSVAEFRQAAGLIRQDPEVRETVDRVVQEMPERVPAIPRETVRRPAKRRWLTFMPPALAAAAVALILLITNWRIEIRHTPEAAAVENRLAVMYFRNLADEADTLRFGEIAANLLITDLSESHYLQVVSSQRLYDILNLLGYDGMRAVDRETASQAARQARAQWLLTGTVLQLEPRIELTAQLVEMPSGNVIAAQRVSGEPGDDIFSLVDKLSVEVKKDLGLPAAVQDEPDRRVADVTTHSPEAYRHYLEGIQLWWKFYWDEAAASFYKAIELDSTFAMAYYYLSMTADRTYIAKAMQYVDNAGRRGQYYIRGQQAAVDGDYDTAIQELQQAVMEFPDEKEAYYQMGLYSYNQRKFEDAIGYFNQAIRIDSAYKRCYNNLAYAYDRLGNYENAIEAINRYIALAPDEPNPWDSKGEICARNGRVDLAVESFRTALKIKPNFPSSMYNLAHLQLQVQEYAEAESVYNALLRSNDYSMRSSARLYLPYIPLSKGKFHDALKLLDQGIAADRAERPNDPPQMNEGYKYLLKAWTYAELRDSVRALAAMAKSMEIHRAYYANVVVNQRHYLVQVLVALGELDAADSVTAQLKADLEQAGPDRDPYWLAKGYVELARGNPDSAIANVERIPEDQRTFNIQFLLGRAYLEAGRLGDAVAQFENMSRGYSTWRAFCTVMNVKLHYYLGIAYEKSHWYDRAAEQYEKFLTIWKNPDHRIPEIEDAKVRLAALLRDAESGNDSKLP